MNINYKGKTVEVTNTGKDVRVYRVGIRKVYLEESTGQHFVKSSKLWYKFPQEIDY